MTALQPHFGRGEYTEGKVVINRKESALLPCEEESRVISALKGRLKRAK